VNGILIQQAPALETPSGVKLGFADMLAAVAPGLPDDVAAWCVSADSVANAAVCPLLQLPKPCSKAAADPKPIMDALEAMLIFSGKPFLGGEIVTSADHAVAATLFPLYTMVRTIPV
jgi:glutathione S-transferase